MIIANYDNIPLDEMSRYLISGWRIDGDLKTNVMEVIDGRPKPVWPALVDGVWKPAWVVVE